MTEPSTPLMRQYAAVKKEHPTALLFFRLGDFYELFFDDAVVASKELQITLTSRNKEKGIAVPMCGVPYHAAEGYIGKLIRKGFKVAICEQMEDARLAKKLVRREVTRVVTPGTAADSSLGSEENNFLAALAQVGDRVGFAALDLSTGEFRATEFSGESALRRVQEELEQLRPKELLYGSAAPLFDAKGSRASLTPTPPLPAPSPQPRAAGSTCAETPLDDWIFAPDHAIPLLENHFGVLSLEGFGLAGRTAAAAAAGAILYYVRSTQRGIARSRRPHRLVRAAELPGAGRGYGPQSGVDRAAVRRGGCGRHPVSLHRRRGHADGQAAAAGVVAAAVARSGGDQCAPGCGRSRRERYHRARGVAARAGWRARSGAAFEPRHAGDGESAGCAGAGGVAGKDSGGARLRWAG